MVTKTTGEEFLRFYLDPRVWPAGAYHEDEIILVDGQEAPEDLATVPSNSMVSIDGGDYYDSEFCRESQSFELVFRKWKKKQSTVSVVIEVDKTRYEDLKEMLRSFDAKVKII